MKEKMFNEEKVNLKEIEHKINNLIKKNETNMDNKLLEKWNLLPVIFLEKEKIVNSFINLVKYIDYLNIGDVKKVSVILTTIYVIEELKLDITELDANSAYILISYLDTLNIEIINESFNKLNSQDLLEKVRIKSLDLNLRINILKYIDSSDLSVPDASKMLDETDYYELVNKIS